MSPEGIVVREVLIENIVCRDRGEEQYLHYISANSISPEVLTDASSKTLASVPPKYGSCVMLSAGLVAVLKVHYSVHAIAVLDDLTLDGVKVFECQGNLPIENKTSDFIEEEWSGHCWVEVGNVICDLSIFRTAYAIEHPSWIKQFIETNFGQGKGALLSPVEYLPKGIEFTPKFVLNDYQISGILGGLAHQQNNAT